MNYVVDQYENFSDFKCDITELNGDSYKIQKEMVLLHLGWMDIDYAIRKNELTSITATNTPYQVDVYEKWEISNRLFVVFIKTKISAGICGSIKHHENVKYLIKAIDEHMWPFQSSICGFQL